MASARDNPGAPQQKQGWQKLIGKQSHVDIMRKFRDQLVAARKFRETCRVKEEISSLFGSLGGDEVRYRSLWFGATATP